MSQKLLIGLALVLAVAAFAVVPVAAQAAPHYYSNGTLNSSEPRQVTAWGTFALTLTTGSGTGNSAACRAAVAGFVDNPVGGGAGGGATHLFATYDCFNEKICIVGATPVVVPENLPWTNLLTEEVTGTIRQETKGVKLTVECVKNKVIESGGGIFVPNGEKGPRPKFVNGTSATHPSFLEFDAGAGELEREGSGGAQGAKIEAEFKTLGLEEQELIKVKNP
jgi:hypothetical protein